MAQATTQATFTSQTISVEPIGAPFAEVRRRLERALPKLDVSIAEVLHNGDQKRAKDYDETGLKLSIFEERDHGALLQIFGRGRNARQYEIPDRLKDDPLSALCCSLRAAPGRPV